MAPKLGRGRRFLHGLARFVAWLLPGAVALVLVVGGAAFLWLRTEAGNAWLLAQVLGLVQPTAGAIEADGLETDLLHHLTLRGVRVRDPDGAVLIAVDRVEADLDTEALLGRLLPVHRLDVTGLRVDLPDPGVFGRMWPGDPTKPSAPWAGLPFDVVVEKGHVAGAVAVSGKTVDDLRVDLGLTVRGRTVAWSGLTAFGSTEAGPLTVAGAGLWEPAHLVLQGTAVTVGDEHVNRVAVDGALSDDKLAFTLDTVHFDKDGLAVWVPGLADLPLLAPVDASGRVSGTVQAPEVALTVTTAGGVLTVAGSVEPATRVWTATVDTGGFSTRPVIAGVEPATLLGHVEAKGVGWTWPDALTADGALDARLLARGETISAKGPLHVEGGRLSLTRLAASTTWAHALVSGDVDVPGARLALDVHTASASLRRFGAAGQAGFTGTVEAGWAGPVTAHARGALALADLAAGGATVARASGPVDAGWDGRNPTGTATLTVADAAFAGRHAATGTVHVDLGEVIAYTAKLDEPDRPIVDLDGRFTVASRTVEVARLAVEVAPGLTVTNAGPLRATLVTGGVRDVDAAVALGEAALSVHGGVSAHGRDTMLADVEGFDLALLDRLMAGKFPGWAGTASGRVGLVGTLDAPQLQGVAEVHGLTIPEQVTGLDAQVVVDGDGRTMIVDASAGPAGRPLVHVTGRIPVEVGRTGVRLSEAGAMDARITLPPVQTAEWSAVLAGRPLPEARLSAELRATGSVAAPVLALTGSADVPLGPSGPASRVWLEAGLSGGDLTVRTVLNEAFQSRLEANLHGRLAVAALEGWLAGRTARPEPRSLVSGFGGTVQLKQLPITTIRRFVSVPGDVAGALDGAFEVGGAPWAPRLEGAVDAVDGRVGQLSLTSAHLELHPNPLGYLVKANVDFGLVGGVVPKAATCAGADGGPVGGLTLAGFVPLGDDFALDRGGLFLTLGGAGLPLSVAEAFSSSLLDTGGCLVVGGEIHGSLAAPDLNLGFNLKDGGTTVPALGERLSAIGVHGQFQDNQLVVTSIHAHTSNGQLTLDDAKGDVDGRATVRFENWLPSTFDAEVALDGAWLISTADRRARVSGALKAKGKRPVVDVSGHLTVDDGFLRLSERFFAGERQTALHPDIEVVRPGAKAVAAADGAAGASSGFALDVRPDVDVDLARHLGISVAMPLQGGYGDLARALSTVTVNTNLDGTVKVRRVGGLLSLTGDVDTVRGDANVLGRPFDLSDGTVSFTGTDYRAPILNLNATHHADCGEITVRIGGLPGSPSLTFSSDSDALPDNDSVIRALVLGTCDEAGSAGASDEALSQTLGLVTEMLTKQAVGQAAATVSIVRIERLEVDPTGTARIAFALGRNVFLTSEYTPTPATASDNTFTVRLEVGLPYRLFLGFESGDRGASKIRLYRKWRF